MDINKRIGDYEILEELGRGGMGRVYRVRNVISDRVEAMKVLLDDLVSQPELESRFLREIKVLAALEHPNIATLRTAMKDGKQVVMIMEFVDGETLSQRIKRGPLPVHEALAHIDQVLEALSYAHARGVIHRDIKPANMMLTSEGLVKLTDFGIARSQNDATLTAAGTTTGSLFYMSPEQVNAEATDARSDLYSVGISLYEMVTGQRPFQADSDFAVMVAHLKEMPRPPIELEPQLGNELNAVIMKAIAKAPSDRYQTADDFRAALTTVPAFPTSVGAAVIAVPPPPKLSEAVTIAKTAAVPRTGTVTPISPERVRSLMDAPTPAAAAATVPPVPSFPPVPQPVMRKPANAVLYMAIGGVFAIGALVAAAFYFNSTRSAAAGTATTAARAPAAATAATAPAAPTPASSPAPATAAPAPASSAPAPAGAAAAPATASAPAATAPASASTTAAAPPADATAPATSSAAGRPSGRQGAGDAGPGRLPPAARRAAARVQARENAAAGAPAAATSATAPSQPTEPAVDFDELELELDQLTARVVAINTSLDNLRREQARQGLGLRADITARQQTMNANITRAEEAVKQRNAARAQRFKAAAEVDVEALERFLGR